MTISDQQAGTSADSDSAHHSQCKCGHHGHTATKTESCGSHGASCGCGGHGHEHDANHQDGCGCGHHHQTVEPASEKKSCGCGRLKPFRKIHTICGVAFGLFVVGHFAVLATAWRPEKFSQNAQALHTLSANLPAIEIVGLLLPAAALVICGLYLLWSAGLRYNAKKCNRGGKLRFFLQRMTALFLLGFLLVHVVSFSTWGNRLLGIQSTSETSAGFDSAQAMNSAVSSMRHPFGILRASEAAPLMATVMMGMYAIGIAALAYHLSNGLWTAAVMWGIIPSESCQQRWLKACVIIGICIAALGFTALAAFVRG